MAHDQELTNDGSGRERGSGITSRSSRAGLHPTAEAEPHLISGPNEHIEGHMPAEPWWPILNSLLSGLVGAAVVYYFGIRQLVAQRRIAFLERQLSEFYAPLAGMHKQNRVESELRLKVTAAANGAWQDVCESYGDRIMRG